MNIMAAAGSTKIRARLGRVRTRAQASLDRLRGVRRYHYLHIGKTGGTALKAALRAIDHPGTRFLLHQHQVSLGQIQRGEPVFFFVRDPVARFTSGFLSRQRQGRPRHNFPWTVGEAEAFARFETPNALALALSSEDSEAQAQAKAAMNAIGHVRDSLWRWLHDEDHLRARKGDILFVGCQEHLERDVGTLAHLIDIPIALPDDEVSSHRAPKRVPRELDPQAIANLRRWYDEDYRCLALLREWFPHLPDYGAWE